MLNILECIDNIKTNLSPLAQVLDAFPEQRKRLCGILEFFPETQCLHGLAIYNGLC